MGETKQNTEKKPRQRKPTIREKRLIEEMAKPNVKSKRQAAISAGYAPSTASVDVYKMLEKPSIAEAIQKRIDRALKHTGVTPEEVIGAAAFQMRSSMDDVIGETGGFSLEKARNTGAIDLVKKIEITEKPIFGTGEVERTYKVEMLSNQDGRKEIADYMGIKRLPRENPETLQRIITKCRALADKYGTSVESELEIYLSEFAQPEMRERLQDVELVRKLISGE